MSANVVNALTRAVSWTAGLIEGLVSGILISPRSPLAAPTLVADESFGELRLAILGRSRRQIATVLGTPPTASLGFGTRMSPKQPMTYWQATVWYYPFDQRDHKAIAIRFVGDRAREVEFIGVP